MMPLGPGAFGEKKKLWVMLPTPNWSPAPGKISLWLVTGRMVREITFQSWLIEIGTTGWMLR